MRNKYKIGQELLAFNSNLKDIEWVTVVGIRANNTYIVRECGSLSLVEKEISEDYLAKNIRQMVKKVLGKDYVWTTVLEEYLKNHYKENKNESNND